MRSQTLDATWFPRYLWQPADVEAAIQYVISGQEQPMAVYETPTARLRSRLRLNPEFAVPSGELSK